VKHLENTTAVDSIEVHRIGYGKVSQPLKTESQLSYQGSMVMQFLG